MGWISRLRLGRKRSAPVEEAAVQPSAERVYRGMADVGEELDDSFSYAPSEPDPEIASPIVDEMISDGIDYHPVPPESMAEQAARNKAAHEALLADVMAHMPTESAPYVETRPRSAKVDLTVRFLTPAALARNIQGALMQIAKESEERAVVMAWDQTHIQITPDAEGGADIYVEVPVR